MSQTKDPKMPAEKAAPGASNPVPSKPPVAQSQPPPPPAPPGRPPPKNPGKVTVTIDGTEIAVDPQTNMIEAAARVGAAIPYFCYHPRLSVAANCRQCMVQVSNSPKLVPACQTPLAEGQVIETGSQKARDQQRANMEFLLLNHPVDCAICDQAGECRLQDYYMTHDNLPSRLEHGKVQKNKRKILGPTIVLDQERCILCTRCVRFMEEVAKEPQLGVFGRGSHEVLDIFPGQELTSNYSGNIADICPVGALLNRDTRFKARSWFLSASPSTCTGCSRGCSIWADSYGQVTHRYRPRENEAINASWMCDKGRASYRDLATDRLFIPTVGRGNQQREVSREEARQSAAEALKAHVGSGLAVLVTPTTSNEDLMAALHLAREQLGLKEVFVGGRDEGEADHYLLTADRNPNRKGLEWVAKGMGITLRPFSELQAALQKGSVKALWAVGHEVPVDAVAFAQSLESLEQVVVQSTHRTALTAVSTVALPAASHLEDEGTFTQQDGITQRHRKAYPAQELAMPHWQWVTELVRALGSESLWRSARDVFQAVKGEVAELADYGWDTQAPRNKERRGINPIATAADGRPPGYREFGAPRVRGI